MAHASYPMSSVDEDIASPVSSKPKSLDWDVVCAYKTFKIVRIKDRYLGILYWSIVTLVILYIIIFAFLQDGKHQTRGSGLGLVITKFHGKAYDENNLAFDEADLRLPVIEPYGGFFITKSIKQKEQEIRECIDYDFPCTRQMACESVGGKCVGGYCKHQTWCPSIALPNAANSSTVSRTRISLADTNIELMAAIKFFPGISDTFFVAGNSPGGVNPLRHAKLSELLALANPPVNIDDIIDSGAFISVSFLWNCDVMMANCPEPVIVIKRLDEGKGFFQRHVRRYRVKGVAKREAVLLFGLRIFVESSGEGRKINFVYLVIQLGSCLALLRTASMAADFLMLSCYPKKKADMYRKCKVIETKDYSDLQDRLDLIQERAPEVETLLTKDRFGLGPGGRGGMASVILRGNKNVS